MLPSPVTIERNPSLYLTETAHWSSEQVTEPNCVVCPATMLKSVPAPYTGESNLAFGTSEAVDLTTRL